MQSEQKQDTEYSVRSTYIVLFFIAAIWGTNLVMIKYLVHFFTPFALAAIRIPVAASILLPISVLRYGWLNLSREGWILTGAISMFSIFLHQLLLSSGLATTSGTHSALILGLNPLFTTVAASYYSQEPFTWNKGVGVLLGLGGVLVVVSSSTNSGTATLNGDVMVFISMLVYVAGSLFVKRSTQVAPALVVTTYSHILAGIGLLPVAYFSEPTWIREDIWQFWPIALLLTSGWICTGLGAFFWNHAIGKVGASIASLFLNILPVAGVFASALFLDEPLGWKQFAALVLVLAGVMLGTGAIALPGGQRACMETEK